MVNKIQVLCQFQIFKTLVANAKKKPMASITIDLAVTQKIDIGALNVPFIDCIKISHAVSTADDSHGNHFLEFYYCWKVRKNLLSAGGTEAICSS